MIIFFEDRELPRSVTHARIRSAENVEVERVSAGAGDTAFFLLFFVGSTADYLPASGNRIRKRAESGALVPARAAR